MIRLFGGHARTYKGPTRWYVGGAMGFFEKKKRLLSKKWWKNSFFSANCKILHKTGRKMRLYWGKKFCLFHCLRGKKGLFLIRSEKESLHGEKATAPMYHLIHPQGRWSRDWRETHTERDTSDVLHCTLSIGARSLKGGKWLCTGFSFSLHRLRNSKPLLSNHHHQEAGLLKNPLVCQAVSQQLQLSYQVNVPGTRFVNSVRIIYNWPLF